jgi:hypothetical protein
MRMDDRDLVPGLWIVCWIVKQAFFDSSAFVDLAGPAILELDGIQLHADWLGCPFSNWMDRPKLLRCPSDHDGCDDK